MSYLSVSYDWDAVEWNGIDEEPDIQKKKKKEFDVVDGWVESTKSTSTCLNIHLVPSRNSQIASQSPSSPRSIKSMSSHYLFPSSTPPRTSNSNTNTMPTPPPVPTSRSNRSFENHPPPPLPSSVSSPTPNRSRKSFPVISQQQQGRGGSYVTPPMANGRRMTSNPVRLLCCSLRDATRFIVI